MKIIFFGSSNFAVPALKALLEEGREISCVVTQPDRAKGRGLHLGQTAVKNTAAAGGIKIYQPQDINAQEAVEFIKKFGAELFIVLSYGQILSEKVLELPGILCLNAHASLLPEYRGAAPINWALMRGEKESGVTIIKIEKKMDAGPVILQKKINIEGADTAVSLENKLALIAASLIREALVLIENKKYKLTSQDQAKATFAPKLKKEDGLINWNLPAEDIHNLIRGTLPWPGAFTYYQGKLLKIYKARVLEGDRQSAAGAAGEITTFGKDGIILSTGNGRLAIEELQLEGSRRMTGQEFIAGHKISTGDFLGKN